MTTPRLFVSLLFIALLTLTVREIADPDFWWHLRTGQFIVENRTVPRREIFSFTRFGAEWIAHEWLSETIIYLIYRVGGLPLLSLVFSGIITLAFALTYIRCAGPPYFAGFALLLGALATAPTWGVRPQMISLLWLSVYLFLLDKYTTDSPSRQSLGYLFPLPLLMLLWVNLHSGYALGLAAIGIYLIAAIWEHMIAGRPHSTGRSKTHPYVRGLAVALVSTFLVVLVNPNGARMYIYPFETLTSPTMQRYIQEWFSPDFHQIEWLPFALLLLTTLAAALVARASVPLAQILLLFFFGLAALRSARHVPLFALVAVPVLAAQMTALFKWKPSLGTDSNRAARIINGALLALFGLAALGRIMAVLNNQARVERAKFPTVAVDWIRANHPAPNLYNTYDWGGYLIWKLYPEYPVYIDGRADVYGDQFIEQFLEIYRAAAGWEERLERQGVRLVLVEPTAPLAQALVNDARWEQVIGDAQSVLYRRK